MKAEIGALGQGVLVVAGFKQTSLSLINRCLMVVI